MKIYLASPYTSNDPDVVHERVIKINKAAAELMRDGHIVFSPISHSHPIAMQEDLPTAFEFWQVQNHAFIEWADVMVVLTIDGWKTSKGIEDEIEHAHKIGTPVKLLSEVSV